MKHFKGSTHLATTPKTTFKEAKPPVQGPALLENPEIQGKVPNFNFGDKFNTFIASHSYKRKITEMSQQKYIKCKNCGVQQRQAEYKRDASVQLKVQVHGQEMWLAALMKAIQSLLAVSEDGSLMSNFDTIEELLMDLHDIDFSHNVNTNVHQSVISLPLKSTYKHCKRLCQYFRHDSSWISILRSVRNVKMLTKCLRPPFEESHVHCKRDCQFCWHKSS